jgi:hypothetical protein
MPLVGSDPAESATDPNWPAKLDIQEIGATWFPMDPEDPASPLLLQFSIAIAGTARIPVDTHFRVYLDHNRDGKYDEAIYNAYGPNISPNAPAGTFLVAHGTISSDGITPNLPAGGSNMFYQVFDIDDQVIRLVAMAAELNGGDFDLSQGDVSFNFAVTVADSAEDYPVSGSFLGDDRAPDGALDKTPEQFTYDQSVADCLNLVGPNGEDLGRLGERYFTVPGGATNVTPLRLQAVCEPPAGGADTGIFMVNETNIQGQAGYSVRKGRLGALPAVFLPYLAMHHAFMPEASLALAPVGDEGVAGTARLVQKGANLEVTLSLPTAPTDAPHPAHIHVGSCANPGEVYKPLNAVENGMSVTLLADLTLADVTTGQHYINVHKSSEAADVSISCGDIAP